MSDSVLIVKMRNVVLISGLNKPDGVKREELDVELKIWPYKSSTFQFIVWQSSFEPHTP